MISNSRIQTTLLSFLFKKFNIIKKSTINKETLKLYAFFSFNYTQRSAFKAIIKRTIPQYLKQTHLRSRRSHYSLLLAILSPLFS
jgi:hypothetical protein